MYLLKIIPIAKGLPEEYFSYFSSGEIKAGSIVEIRIRNRKVWGLVLENENLKNKKLEIKNQKFSLKKIESLISSEFIPYEIINSLIDSTYLTGAKLSELLDNYLPEAVFQNLNLFKESKKIKSKNNSNKTQALILNLEEQISLYLKIIQANLKKNYSTVIFSPTIHDLEFTEITLKEYFKPEQIISFHSQLKKKDFKINLEKLNSNTPYLILATPQILPFLTKNLQTVILHKENSYNYFTHAKKRQIDARIILKKLAQDLNLDLILTGNLLSLETFRDYKVKNNISLTKNLEIIDMKKDTTANQIKPVDKKISKYNKVYFSRELSEKLEKIKKSKGQAFFFVKRKGLFPETICQDCNQIFKCPNCDKPYTLYKKNQIENIFICSHCKNKVELKKENLTCKNCGGWRMQTLGIAIDGLNQELEKLNFQTFILDLDTVKTRKQILKTLENWQATPGSILLGTELALNFLNKGFVCDIGAIISLDSLFSIPEMNIDEKIFNLCLEMQNKVNSSEKILIQTRLPEQEIWRYIKENKVKEFLENELEIRKMLSLPPFTKILKFKLNTKNQKNKLAIERVLEQIYQEEKIKDLNLNWKLDKKNNDLLGIISIPYSSWEIINEKNISPTNLAEKITSLLVDFKLEINPPNVN